MTETPSHKPTTQVSAWMPQKAAVPAEVVFLGIVLVLTLFFTLAGIPGTPTPVAGGGSEQLRKGWLAEHGTADGTRPAEAQPDAQVEPTDQR